MLQQLAFCKQVVGGRLTLVGTCLVPDVVTCDILAGMMTVTCDRVLFLSYVNQQAGTKISLLSSTGVPNLITI